MTVNETDGTANANVLAEGVEVDLEWVGPDGTGILEGSARPTTSTTRTTTSNGSFEVAVTAPQDVSSGTLSIVEVRGEPVASESATLTFDRGAAGTSATKTWIDYEVTGFDEAVNPVGTRHTSTFEVDELRPGSRLAELPSASLTATARAMS